MDHIGRSEIYEQIILFFTANEVYVIKRSTDTICHTVTEATSVLFYEDIVSISTEQQYHDDFQYISFKLYTRGGNVLSVDITNNDEAYRSINVMRAIVKEKKMGLL